MGHGINTEVIVDDLTLLEGKTKVVDPEANYSTLFDDYKNAAIVQGEGVSS